MATYRHERRSTAWATHRSGRIERRFTISNFNSPACETTRAIFSLAADEVGLYFAVSLHHAGNVW
ncbi:MAG: hypothetical protein WCC80_12850, partial [Pseudolabrys sp.]